MSIQVRCSCGRSYQVADKLAGKKFKCKSCEKVLAIRRPAARAKAQTVDGDEDSGFLDMNLDAEFSRMAALERQPIESDDAEWDVATERDYRYQDGDMSRADTRYQPQATGVERSAGLVLGILGIVVGIGLFSLAVFLRVQYGWRVRGLIGMGIASFVGGIGFLVKGV